MTDVQIRVESNVQHMDELAAAGALRDVLGKSVSEGADFLRSIVPHQTGAMAAHVSHHEPSVDPAGVITADVGIPPINQIVGMTPAVKDSVVPGEQGSSNYPLFRDRGTGEFGPGASPIFARRVHYMKFDNAEGNTIFRKSVKGSPGSHFMFATYATMMLELDARMHAVKTAIDAGAKFPPS